MTQGMRSLLGSLSNSVFELRTSTGSRLFASLGSGLVETLEWIVFIREKELSNTNLLESRHIYSEKASLPVDVRRSKTSLLKLPRPFPHSCKQRRQVEARVDKIQWFGWNCPPEARPHFFMFTHWSVMREKVYSYKKLLTIWEAISNTRHSFLFRYADTSKTFLIESAALSSG